LGPVDRKSAKRVQDRFAQALGALQGPIEHARAEQKQARLALIERIEGLKDNAAERSVVDTVKSAQAQWQQLAKTLSLERREEQALWRRFRASCDAVFVQRSVASEAEDAARNANLQRRQELCQRLEAMHTQSEPVRRLRQLLVECEREWATAGPAPGKLQRAIQERFEAARAQFLNRLQGLEGHREKDELLLLWTKAQLCSQLESGVPLESGTPTPTAESAAEMLARVDLEWAALAPLPNRWEESLGARYQAARAALSEEPPRQPPGEGLPQLRRTCLRLELLTGQPSPVEVATERKTMQLEMLAAAMRSGLRPTPTEIRAEMVEALCQPVVLDADTRARLQRLVIHIASGASPASR
jgi:hypothetical protein